MCLYLLQEIVNTKITFYSLLRFDKTCYTEIKLIGSKYNHHDPEAAIRGVLLKKVFLEILQNLHENICARVSVLIKSQASGV